MSAGPLWLQPWGGAVPFWLVVAGGAVLGALVGSFLGAAVVRMPEGRSVVTGRSACDGCGAPLGVGELVPIASFLALRGRCRGCGEPIDRWQFAAELGGALVGALALATASGVAAGVAGMLLGWQLLLLGLLDARHFWLPRRLVLLLAASGLATVAALRGARAEALGEALAGAALGFGMLWLAAWAYRAARGREGMGGGDPGLLGALGIWLGPVGVTATVLAGSLVGLAAAAALALAGRTITARTALPLGSALALAGWLVWLLQPH